jgi:hypothetical protein
VSIRLAISAVLILTAVLIAGRADAQSDLSGEWAIRLHSDQVKRFEGPRLGDYTGLPINDAARLRADSWDAKIHNVHEHQNADYSSILDVWNPSNLRISKIVDDVTQQVIGFKLFHSPYGMFSRMIWMDDRPSPPAYAAHTWQGFSSGKWEGATLTVTTTHVKASVLERNGVPHTDDATMTEHYFRHGNYLTIVSIVTDPVYLEEPLIRSTMYVFTPEQQLPGGGPQLTADELPGLADGAVPHHLPGTNDQLREFADSLGVPVEVTRGGKASLYPEYQLQIRDARSRAQSR